MRSRAAIGNHPIHPALVPIPIGAFFLVLVGDIAHTSTQAAFWYQFSEATEIGRREIGLAPEPRATR